MASTQHKVSSPCPVCQQTDQVMPLQVAYESGAEQRFAPPPMPVSRPGMMRSIIVGFALVIVGVFIILTFAGVGGYANWPQPVQVTLVVLVLAGIVTALVLSLIAFLRIVKSDNQTLQYLPAWDGAMENWRRLYYCRRDDVVFDPQTNKTLSDAAVKSMLTVNMSAPAQPAQQAAASHQ
jgi:heme/copper-type cytochrome/quinol oxidase subunit 4